MKLFRQLFVLFFPHVIVMIVNLALIYNCSANVRIILPILVNIFMNFKVNPFDVGRI